jgi:hypothetical protein
MSKSIANFHARKSIEYLDTPCVCLRSMSVALTQRKNLSICTCAVALDNFLRLPKFVTRSNPDLSIKSDDGLMSRCIIRNECRNCMQMNTGYVPCVQGTICALGTGHNIAGSVYIDVSYLQSQQHDMYYSSYPAQGNLQSSNVLLHVQHRHTLMRFYVYVLAC